MYDSMIYVETYSISTFSFISFSIQVFSFFINGKNLYLQMLEYGHFTSLIMHLHSKKSLLKYVLQNNFTSNESKH